MRLNVCLVVCLVLGLSIGSASGQKKRAPQKPKKPASPRVVRGTAQMAGDNGKIGTTYTLGKANDYINFTLLSAEYWPSRIAQAHTTYVPKADEKYLILHYTLHNPNPREFAINWTTLSYTAVDSHDVNHKGTGLFMKEGTPDQVNLGLKPAQKIAMVTAILIPADASVPKLIVQRGSLEPVLRLYFQKGDIKPPPAPFADASDTSGCVVLKDVPTEPGTYYAAGHFDVMFVSGATVTGKYGRFTPRRDRQFFVATLKVRNATLLKQRVVWTSFQAGVQTEDGEKTNVGTNDTLHAQRDESLNVELEPGEETTIRTLIQVPTGAKVKQFRLREGPYGRLLLFRVGETA